MSKDIRQLFRILAQNGQLAERLDAHSTLNVPAPTFGGPVFWETEESNGWKLQFNKCSGWWRILDKNDVRVARGTSEEQLKNLLADKPTSLLQNYFDEGFRFSKTPARRQAGKCVILIHGWGVRSISMQQLADGMSENGYDAYIYDYPTAECHITRHTEIFLEKYRKLVAAFPANEEIYFLTHSMGGLILRDAMSRMTEAECRRISAIVMLGPPNRGSGLAYFGKLPGAESINASLGDMTPDDDSYVMKIPSPAWMPPTGIIAGRNDGKVAVENTHLPSGLSYRHIVVDSDHPGLRNPSNTLKHILSFFDKHAF